MSAHKPPQWQDRYADDVVISGVGCRLPQSDNMEEFRQHLLNKEDMVTEDDSRWEPGYLGTPRRHAKLKDLTKFDASFFGIHPKKADVMDPGLRILLECAYEAIVDAGVNPTSLRGSKTGVYVGTMESEALEAYLRTDTKKLTGYELMGSHETMLPNRVSFFFDLRGPSLMIDTFCSSSLLAMDLALQDIRMGKCDRAIIGGKNLCLNPVVSLAFVRQGMLSPDGTCKSCDASANGYRRAEGIQAVYLQKATEAKRVYATVVHSKNNCNGFKERGLGFPSRECQRELLEEVYQEIQLDPSLVNYVEAHATGTAAGDPQELNAIGDVLCGQKRESPLLVSCLKSSIGHSEGCSGLAAVAKAIISMEDQQIPANLHYKTPNPDIEKLATGELVAVTEHTPWAGGYCAINSFGFGGSNVHAVLHSNEKDRTLDHPAAKQERVFTFSGRTEEGLQGVLAKMESEALDVELQALLQENSNTIPSSHPYRGYTVLNASQQITAIQKCSSTKLPVWFVMTGMGAQWPKMGRDMLRLDAFRSSILRSDAILCQVGFKLYNLLTEGDDETFNTPMNSFLGLVSIQMALIDVLRELGIKPDGMIGHSVGELACAYADRSMTAEETLMATYYRGKCLFEHIRRKGSMAAVGMGWDTLKARLPEDLYAACHNTEDTQTISGPTEKVEEFVAKLKSEDVFAKKVNSAGIPFHSPYLEPGLGPLGDKLREILTAPRPKRSAHWISTSVPEDKWDHDSTAMVVGPDYILNNLRNPVLFQEAMVKIPQNAVIIEIGAHGLLLPMLKRALGSDVSLHSLMQRSNPTNLEFFYGSLGKLYTQGIDFNPLKLYPEVKYPVARGTPMISPLIKWDHSNSWGVPATEVYVDNGGSAAATQIFELNMSEGEEHEYLLDHIIDGHVIMPATGYLELAWRACAKLNGKEYDEFPVVMEDVQMHAAIPISGDEICKLEVSILPLNGHFEIREGGKLACSGRVFPTEKPRFCLPEPWQTEDGLIRLNFGDIKKQMNLVGFDHGPNFQGIMEMNGTAKSGYLKWTGNWCTFIDTMIQTMVMKYQDHILRLPTKIGSVKIDPTIQNQFVMEKEYGQACQVRMEFGAGIVRCGAVEIIGCHLSLAPRATKQGGSPTLQHVEFIPYVEQKLYTSDDALSRYTDACRVVALNKLRELEMLGKVKLPASLQDEIKSVTTVDMDKTVMNANGPSASLLSQLLEPNGAKHIFLKDQLLNSLTKERSLKATIDIAIENSSGSRFKVCEYVGNGKGHALFPSYVPQTSGELMLDMSVTVVGKDPSLLDEEQLQKYGVTGMAWDLGDEVPSTMTEADLVVASYALSSANNLEAAVNQLGTLVRDNGFFLIQEPTRNFAIPLLLMNKDGSNVTDAAIRTCGPFCTEDIWEDHLERAGFELVAKKSDGFLNTLFLFRKLNHGVSISDQTIVEVNDLEEYGWVDGIKEAMRDCNDKPEGHNIWLWADTQRSAGVVGLANCLKREPGGERFRCILDASLDRKTPPLKLGPSSFAQITQRNLVMNVYRDGVWGSFRHLSVSRGLNQQTVQDECAYINTMTRGDLSSFRWYQSPIRHCYSMGRETQLCKVYYSGLNFRDMMYATGRLSPDAIPDEIRGWDTILGLDWAGRNAEGSRVFGLVPAMACSTAVHVPHKFVWKCPDNWSLAEASTVPLCYATSYYALVMQGNIQRDDTVLIHSGASGVGQAAIAIALSFDCRVFTTCGSQEKRDFLKKRFPQLTDDSFACSWDHSFETHILLQTEGRGCDLVLNYLSGDSFDASLRCVSKHGTFLEVGKYDQEHVNVNKGMSMQLKATMVCDIQLDALLRDGDKRWPRVYELIREGIRDGVVRPFQTNIFDVNRIEDAFRSMVQAQNGEKVVLKIREEEEEVTLPDTPISYTALTRAWCDPKKSYIITGGLGGFGLELSYWLYDRGCRHLVLTSRSGIRTGYQSWTVRALQKKGMNVMVSTKNVRSKQETDALIKEAMEMGPVGGIFHLAMVLQDRLMDSQTPDFFKQVSNPKVQGAINLDSATKESCRDTLHWFVTFSSIASGLGNLGQTNYGFCNSFMERLCEQRKHDGLPGLSIQWGAIGDVGVFVSTIGGNDTEVAGSLPQRIASCLETLDHYLCQDKPVVASWVVAEGKEKEDRGDAAPDILNIVAKILGVNDPNEVDDCRTMLALGMDSLMGVEVQQAIRQVTGINLTMAKVRDVTMKDLKEMSAAGDKEVQSDKEVSRRMLLEEMDALYDLELVLPTTAFLTLKEAPHSDEQPPVFMIAAMRGHAEMLRSLSSNLNRTVYGIQGTASDPLTCMEDLAEEYIKIIKRLQPRGPYHLVCYCYGCTPGFEMALQLQECGEKCSLIMLDGAQRFTGFTVRKSLAEIEEMNKEMTQSEFEALKDVIGIIKFFKYMLDNTTEAKIHKKLAEKPNHEERIHEATRELHRLTTNKDPEELATAMEMHYQKFTMCYGYDPQIKYKGGITLIKASDPAEDFVDLGQDYDIGKDCTGDVDIHTVNGNHVSFILGSSAVEVAHIIEDALSMEGGSQNLQI